MLTPPPSVTAQTPQTNPRPPNFSRPRPLHTPSDRHPKCPPLAPAPAPPCAFNRVSLVVFGARRQNATANERRRHTSGDETQKITKRTDETVGTRAGDTERGRMGARPRRRRRRRQQLGRRVGRYRAPAPGPAGDVPAIERAAGGRGRRRGILGAGGETQGVKKKAQGAAATPLEMQTRGGRVLGRFLLLSPPWNPCPATSSSLEAIKSTSMCLCRGCWLWERGQVEGGTGQGFVRLSAVSCGVITVVEIRVFNVEI